MLKSKGTIQTSFQYAIVSYIDVLSTSVYLCVCLLYLQVYSHRKTQINL